MYTTTNSSHVSLSTIQMQVTYSLENNKDMYN